MNRIETALDELSEPLRSAVSALWARFAEQPAAAEVDLDRVAASLPRVWVASEFVAHACVRHPEMLRDLTESGDLFEGYPKDGLPSRLAAHVQSVSSPEDLSRTLRAFRRREMCRIAWRDLAGLAALDETLRDLTRLAETCIDTALARLHAWESERFGTPCDPGGVEQKLVVLGMGKLGGGELNFSSDIDLMFVFPRKGQTNGRRVIDNEEFFRRLGQKLIRILDDRDSEGFVFRVDMRLRPFGQSGPLAMHFDAFEQYYQGHGREWERYAMIKARPVAGDLTAGWQLIKQLRPFVYRRYLDFGAIESLREMKRLIAHEVERKGMERNIKLGPGGIREIEFIAQMFQLIYGGRRSALRARATVQTLDVLAAQRLLPQYAVNGLKHAYGFLRLTENRLQAQQDRQTHDLPTDELGKARLAYAMGFEQWGDFVRTLLGHVKRVQDQFEQVFEAPQRGAAEPSTTVDFAMLWTRAEEDVENYRDFLTGQGYGDPDQVVTHLARFRGSFTLRSLSKNGRTRLDQLMPLLLGAASRAPSPEIVLERVLKLVETIARRSVYLALLVENPLALSQLVQLCAASPWIAEYLGRHPLLLDELLDPETLYEPLEPEQLAGEAAEFVAQVAEDDLEQGMDVLRHFQQTNILRVACADVTGAFPLMVVSDHLTWIAEAVLRQVTEMAWRDLTRRLGEPTCEVDAEMLVPAFAVVAYGKLGGIELGYGSDLDLVFLHDSRGEKQHTNGARQVDNPTFFARLAQRIIHILTTATAAGVLYEVDTRLRPSGSSGLMVTSIDAFADYQLNNAWTWEHQALTRARIVVGPDHLAERFSAIRREVLSRPRDAANLRKEVREMRERMRSELCRSKPGHFHLKQDRGGIVDIEFVVQYLVLAGAHQHSELLTWTDNIRQLDALEAVGVLSEKDAGFLRDAYRALRKCGHRLTLQARSSFVELEGEDEFDRMRRGVARIWKRLMECD